MVGNSKPQLFTPFALRDLTIPNRVLLSPMGQHSADEGVPSDWHLMHLGQYAVSGVGCVITEAAAVSPSARISQGCLGIWGPEHAKGFARIRDFFDRYGSAKFGIQLNHCGRKGSVMKRWERSKPVSVEDGGWVVEGASTIGYPGRVAPVPFTPDRLKDLAADFANAARQAHDGGLDLIEIHAAHGYLLHSFLSPLSNNRGDRYGGSLENRMRFPLEVFEATRAAWPVGKPIGVRVSTTDWAAGGWTEEETLVLCAELKKRGCDYICASSGGTTPDQQIPVEPHYQIPFAERIRREVGIATAAVGLITEPQDAENIIAERKADFVALGRALLWDPRWVWHAAKALGAKTTFPHQYDDVFR